MKYILIGLMMTAMLASCSNDDEPKTCLLERVSIQSPDSYQEIHYNDDGTIASVDVIYSGTWNMRHDYAYESDKLFIYLTDLAVTDELIMEVQFDAQHRPVFRKHDDEHYEHYIYNGDRLDHIMWATNDSIVYTYNGTSKNPEKVVFYAYNSGTQTWTQGATTTLTFDDKINPLKGLILPFENSGNLELFFTENNNTSYSSDGNTWDRTYTYNDKGYPVSRTLSSSLSSYTEITDFTYTCE